MQDIFKHFAIFGVVNLFFGEKNPVSFVLISLFLFRKSFSKKWLILYAFFSLLLLLLDSFSLHVSSRYVYSPCCYSSWVALVILKLSFFSMFFLFCLFMFTLLMFICSLLCLCSLWCFCSFLFFLLNSFFRISFFFVFFFFLKKNFSILHLFIPFCKALFFCLLFCSEKILLSFFMWKNSTEIAKTILSRSQFCGNLFVFWKISWCPPLSVSFLSSPSCVFFHFKKKSHESPFKMFSWEKTSFDTLLIFFSISFFGREIFSIFNCVLFFWCFHLFEFPKQKSFSKKALSKSHEKISSEKNLFFEKKIPLWFFLKGPNTLKKKKTVCLFKNYHLNYVQMKNHLPNNHKKSLSGKYLLLQKKILHIFGRREILQKTKIFRARDWRLSWPMVRVVTPWASLVYVHAVVIDLGRGTLVASAHLSPFFSSLHLSHLFSFSFFDPFCSFPLLKRHFLPLLISFFYSHFSCPFFHCLCFCQGDLMAEDKNTSPREMSKSNQGESLGWFFLARFGTNSVFLVIELLVCDTESPQVHPLVNAFHNLSIFSVSLHFYSLYVYPPSSTRGNKLLEGLGKLRRWSWTWTIRWSVSKIKGRSC